LATKIRVTNGPDAGREFIVQRQRVLIGAEADADIRLSDTQLQGHVVVEYRNAAYHVINMLRYPIWLDGEALAINDRRVWYDQGSLQPSAVTSLVLITDHSVIDPEDQRRVIETDADRNRWTVQTSWVIAAALVVVALMVLAGAGATRNRRSGTAPLTVSAMRRESQRVLETLADETFRNIAQRRGVEVEWRQLSDSLISARLAEARMDRPAAASDYRRVRETARDLVEVFGPATGAQTPAGVNDDSIREVLQMAERIASQKLLEYD